MATTVHERDVQQATNRILKAWFGRVVTTALDRERARQAAETVLGRPHRPAK